MKAKEYFNQWTEEKNMLAACIDAKFRMIAFAEDYHKAKSKEVEIILNKKLDSNGYKVQQLKKHFKL